MKIELSVIITSFKSPSLLELCIDSIKKNVKGITYEIIVADGATEEPTYDLMREKYPEVSFFPHHDNVGLAPLINKCIGIAKGEYLFVINADIIVKDDSVLKLLNYIRKNPKVGMVGPKLINFDNSIQNSCFRFYSPWTILFRRTFLKRLPFAQKHLRRFLMVDEVAAGKEIDVDWLMGSALMISAKALREVRGMDRRFFLYFEDVDWCWRFWEKGYKVMHYPFARAFHYHGKHSANKNAFMAVIFNPYARIHISSYIKFFTKYFGKENPHEMYKRT